MHVALQAKYIDKFNKFLNRAFRYGYTQNKYSMAKMIEERDRLLFNKVMHNLEHCLYMSCYRKNVNDL